MKNLEKKPKLLYFRWPLDRAPQFVKALFDRIFIDGLSIHFDLEVVSDSGDYGEICDRLSPDICMFESGTNGLLAPEFQITNTSAHPNIPKIGFLRADPMCNSRVAFFVDMERWGIDTFFTYVTASEEYTPELGSQMFYWPFAIAPQIYRDYGVDKVIPSLFLGNSDALQYAWRRENKEFISSRIPTLTDRHLAWDPETASRALYGEAYAKLINAAQFVATCGGMTKTLVNKHLEIPGSYACLVTEEIPVLHELGFKDMHNCVMGAGKRLVEKMEHLLDCPEQLMEITKAGYELVHNNHTQAHRTQIRDYYDLIQDLRAGEEIVQDTIASPLRKVACNGAKGTIQINSKPLDRELLMQGLQQELSGNFIRAIELYEESHSFCNYSSEQRFRLGNVYLQLGQLEEAIKCFAQDIEHTTQVMGSLEPDPLTWTYFTLCCLISQNEDTVRTMLSSFPNMRRMERERINWLACLVLGDDSKRVQFGEYLFQQPPGYRRTIQVEPQRGILEQFEFWAEICAVNNVMSLADKIRLFINEARAINSSEKALRDFFTTY